MATMSVEYIRPTTYNYTDWNLLLTFAQENWIQSSLLFWNIVQNTSNSTFLLPTVSILGQNKTNAVVFCKRHITGANKF